MNMPRQTAVVLESDSSKGIGSAITRLLVRNEFKCLCGFEAQQVEKLKAREDSSVRDLISHVDLSLDDRGSIITGVSDIAAEYGTVELLVIHGNNRIEKSISEVSPEDWDTTLQQNLLGPFYALQELAPHMKGNRNRQIILVLPGGGGNVREKQDHLPAVSSDALKRLVETSAQELFPEITVNAVRPGSVSRRAGDTKVRTRKELEDPYKRRLHPEDVAEAVLYLSRRSNKISGKTLSLETGMQFV